MNTSKEFPTSLIKICTDDLNEIIGGTVYPWPIYYDEIKTTPRTYCVEYNSNNGSLRIKFFKDKKEAYEFDALVNKK